MRAGSRAEKSVGELEQDAFADAGGAEEDAHFARSDLERDVVAERTLPSKPMETCSKTTTGSLGCAGGWLRWMASVAHGIAAES